MAQQLQQCLWMAQAATVLPAFPSAPGAACHGHQESRAPFHLPFTSRDAALRKRWQSCQPGTPQAGSTGRFVDLSHFDPAGKPFATGKGKSQDKARVLELAGSWTGCRTSSTPTGATSCW
jgi:hypothetical protein